MEQQIKKTSHYKHVIRLEEELNLHKINILCDSHQCCIKIGFHLSFVISKFFLLLTAEKKTDACDCGYLSL